MARYIKPAMPLRCAKTALLSLLLMLAGTHCVCALPMAAAESAPPDAGSPRHAGHHHAAHDAGHAHEAPQAHCLHGNCDGACGIEAASPVRDAAALPVIAWENADPDASAAIAHSAMAVSWQRQRAPPLAVLPAVLRSAATPVSRFDMLLD